MNKILCFCLISLISMPVLAQLREESYVSLGGIEQFITIRNSNESNPLLLFIHGGPGFSNAAFSPAFEPWVEHFTFVDWDQRGAGRTFSRNGPEGSGIVSIDNISNDGIELVRYLLNRFEQEKLVVVALSFGSIIGLEMVVREPELFSAYVGSGQFVNSLEGDKLGFDLTLSEARRANHSEAIEALETIGGPPWKDGASRGVAKRWATGMTREDDPSFLIRLPLMVQELAARGYTEKEREEMFVASGFSAQQIKLHEESFDARVRAAKLDVPVYLFQGENDLNTVTELAVEWFRALEAPHKVLHIMEGGSHGAFYASADEFLQFLLLNKLHE